jgi:hypothetical protein
MQINVIVYTSLSATLQKLYKSVDNIDAWVGMLVQDHVPKILRRHKLLAQSARS